MTGEMATNERKTHAAAPTAQELSESLDGPAILSNRFFVTINPTGVRIAYGFVSLTIRGSNNVPDEDHCGDAWSEQDLNRVLVSNEKKRRNTGGDES